MLQQPTPPLTAQPLPGSSLQAASDVEDVEMADAETDSSSPLPQDAPLTQDTVQTDEMKKAGIIVNTALRIAICLGCQIAIRPSLIHSHIARTHSLPVTRKFCDGLAKTYNLHKEPTRPGKPVAAIYGFTVFPGYWSCDNCGAAFQVEASIVRHKKEVPDCCSATHKKGPAQSYNAKSTRMFFCVTMPPVNQADTSADPVALIKKSYTPTPFHAMPIKVVGFRDANHFLSIEKWQEHVEGMTGEQIWGIVQEGEPELRELVRGVILDYVTEVVKNLGPAQNAIKVAIGDYNG